MGIVAELRKVSTFPWRKATDFFSSSTVVFSWWFSLSIFSRLLLSVSSVSSRVSTLVFTWVLHSLRICCLVSSNSEAK